MDIPGIVQITPKNWPKALPSNQVFTETANSLLINTWIGNGYYGCLVENHVYMYNDALQKLGFGVLPGQPVDYLPKINYRVYDVDKIDLFFSQYKGKTIFVDNGNVLSLQADNFDMDAVVLRLSVMYKNVLFITSQKIVGDSSQNVIWSGEIIQSNHTNDLMENSYLSRFCNVIVGRNSGAFVFSGTSENLFNSKKTFISFCYEERVATFHVNQPVTSKQVWSGYTDVESVCRVISNEILEVL